MRVALLDGDTLVFAASSAAERVIQWSHWLHTLHADLDEAVVDLDGRIEKIQRDLNADRIIIALSDEERFRPAVMPTYKSNRTGSRKPMIYGRVRDYVHEKYETFQRPGLEGDDVLGILATHPHLIEGEKIVVAIDKDLKQIPGVLYNYDAETLTTITEEAGTRFFYLQCLTGDITDGYPGCPGMGPVSAAKLLDEGRVLVPVEKAVSRGPRKGEVELKWEPGPEGTPWEIITSAYRAAGLGEQVALQNARVARILRSCDYDFKNKEVKLWTPT